MQQLENGDWDEALALGSETLPEGTLSTANAISAALLLAMACFERDDDDSAHAWLARLPPDLAESTDQQNAGAAIYGSALEAFLARRIADGIGELTRAVARDRVDGAVDVRR